MVPPISGQNGLSVSVVMCTYNGAAFVAEQLQSILQQTYPLIEILIFDDASTDETVAILQTIAASYPIIRLHFNDTNIGFTRNFEQAMLAATGDAIAIADQDDIWKNTKIEKMIAAWKPEAPLIYCDSVRFSAQLPTHAKPNPLLRRFEGTDARKLFMYNTVSGHAVMFKKTLLPLILPLPDAVIYDWWMAVVACYHGGVQYLPEVLVYQRLHAANTSMHAENNFNRQAYKAHFKQMIIDADTAFTSAPGMPASHLQVAIKLVHLVRESLNHTFYRPLFAFLFRYRTKFFNKKKRKIAFFSQLKQSVRDTRN